MTKPDLECRNLPLEASANGYLPCTRMVGHTGPCAHPMRPDWPDPAPDPVAKENRVLRALVEQLCGVADAKDEHDRLGPEAGAEAAIQRILSARNERNRLRVQLNAEDPRIEIAEQAALEAIRVLRIELGDAETSIRFRCPTVENRNRVMTNASYLVQHLATIETLRRKVHR